MDDRRRSARHGSGGWVTGCFGTHAAVLGALGTANYDELSVAEVSRRIEGLPTEQLKKVREFEKNNKNRETLIEQIDRKIRANNNS